MNIDELESIIYLKGFKNIQLVPGDVVAELPNYLANHPQTRISLLHLDMDVYEPTIFALRTLWPRLSVGGVLVVDDYNSVEGATRAVDEFIKEEKILSPLLKTPYYSIPSFLFKA